MATQLSRRRIRVVSGILAAATTISLAIDVSAQRANADPVITDVSSYAISVPSSVLIAAADGSDIPDVSDDQYAGILANESRFNSDWLTTSAGRTMSGTATSTPPDPTTLSPADAIAYEDLIATYAGAPATAGATVGVADAVGFALLAPEAAVLLGSGIDRLAGIDVTGGLCADPTGADSQVAQILAVMTVSTCETWKINANARVSMQNNLGTLTTGGLTCYADDASDCLQIVGPTAFEDEPGGENSYCLQATGTGNIGMMFSDNSSVPYMSTAAQAGVDSGEWACDGYGLGTWVFQAPSRNAVTGYCATVSDSCDGSTVATLTETQLDPPLHFACTTTMTDNTSVTQNSATFRVSDGTYPSPSMAAVPPGEAPASVKCDLLGGATTMPVIAPTSTTPAYQAWVTDDPECTNGSCLLDLRQGTESCLFDNVFCDGWVSDPTKDDDYSCFMGTHSVPLYECYVYGTTFNAEDRSTGYAYANPTNGAKTAGQTSTSDVDDVAASIIKRGFITPGLFTEQPDVNNAARTVAAACLAQVALSPTAPLQPGALPVVHLSKSLCLRIAIFSPGDDVEQARDHDADAIFLEGQPSVLHYENSALKKSGDNAVMPRWYRAAAYNHCGSGYVPGTTHCDEYPYYTTMEGGPGASLKNIDATDNTNEGSMVYSFVHQCGLDVVPPGLLSEYVVLPVAGIDSSGVCNTD